MAKMIDKHDETHRQRAEIAEMAARLIAEEGIEDYTLAKRKALARLKYSAQTVLPDNTEVEAALSRYQALFQSDEQAERTTRLRQEAYRLMQKLKAFRPYLTGAVLEGTATRYADVDIQLFTESSKELEIFLLNQNIEFWHSPPRTDRAEAVITVRGDTSCLNLIVYPLRDERVSFRARDGSVRRRLGLVGLGHLLAEPRATQDLNNA